MVPLSTQLTKQWPFLSVYIYLKEKGHINTQEGVQNQKHSIIRHINDIEPLIYLRVIENKYY